MCDLSRNDFIKKIIQIEDALNNRSCQNAVERFRPGDPELQDAFESRKSKESIIGYFSQELPRRGFCYPDGTANYVRFYKYAYIAPDVWSTFLSGKNKPSAVTLRKVIVGLKLSEKEARDFLAMFGQGFDPKSDADNLLLACIDCGYNTPDEVYEIFKHYAEISKDGEKRFPNLYKEPK